jgi:hypothetical protein
MKLTAEEVSKLTGFTKATVLNYAWRLGVGKIEGRQKVFTKAEVKRIDSGKLPPQGKARKPLRKLKQKNKRANH